MALENFKTSSATTSLEVRFINDTPPQYISVPPPGVSYWIPGSGHYEKFSSSTPFDIRSGYRLSNKTPGFNSQNRQFLLKSNDFEYSLNESNAEGYSHSWTTPLSVSVGPGTAGYQDSQIWTTNKFQAGSVGDPTSDWLQTGQMQARATSNLLKNLRNSSFNAAQALGERKQTADLVASTAKKVAGALGNLRRGNFGKAAQSLGLTPRKRAGRRFNSQFATDQGKAIGNAWLELQYGWKPLLSDVYGAMETLSKANNPSGNPNTIFKKATGRTKRKEEPYRKTSTTLPAGYSGFDEIVRTGYAEVIVKTGVTYSVSSPALASMASVGITNPVLLAWELLPYSFVIDWFLPIGNYLESLDATAGLTFYEGYITTYRKFQGTTTWSSSYSYSSGQQHFYRFIVENYKSIKVVRSKLANFPAAPAPRFKNPLSTSHVSSAMALLLQLKR